MDINNRVDLNREKEQKHTNANKSQQPTRHVGRPRRTENISSGENDPNKNKILLNADKIVNQQAIDTNQSAMSNESLPTSLNPTTNLILTLKENGNNIQVFEYVINFYINFLEAKIRFEK